MCRYLNTMVEFIPYIRGAGGLRGCFRELAGMKRLTCVGLLIAILIAVHPAASHSKMLDGFALESATTLNRGAWNLKSYLEFGSGAEPLTVNTGGSNVAIKVDSIRLPVEIRYGLADNWEVGGDLGFESDDGTKLTAGGTTTSFLDGSGLQRFRFLGKWNFFRDMAAMADLAFLGDNSLYYSLDSFDLGIKFMYGPQMGAGTLNLNLGFLIKGGDPDIDGDGKSSAAESYGTMFMYGIGYVYPYSDRFSGSFEIAGSSSPYDGGSGVSAKSLLSFLLGARYGFTDQMLLDGGIGIGLGDGSPNFLLKVGMDWMWGAAPEYTSTAPSSERGTPSQGTSSRWTPSGETKKTETPAPATTPEKPKPAQPYYEPPTAYETPKPPAPAPTGPSTEEMLQTRVADASAAFNRSDFVTAATQYEAAIKIKDNDPVLHYNLATAYFQLKRYADAKTYYKNAVSLNPADVDSRLYLGYTYYYLQDQASATREWQKVLEIDPSNSLARENLKSLGVE